MYMVIYSNILPGIIGVQGSGRNHKLWSLALSSEPVELAALVFIFSHASGFEMLVDADVMVGFTGYEMDEHSPDSNYLRLQFSRFPGPRSGPGSRSKRWIGIR